jgi:hypothetical protein
MADGRDVPKSFYSHSAMSMTGPFWWVVLAHHDLTHAFFSFSHCSNLQFSSYSPGVFLGFGLLFGSAVLWVLRHINILWRTTESGRPGWIWLSGCCRRGTGFQRWNSGPTLARRAGPWGFSSLGVFSTTLYDDTIPLPLNICLSC